MRGQSYKERLAQEAKQKQLDLLKEEIELEEILLADLEGQCLNGLKLDHTKIVELKRKAEEKARKLDKMKRKFAQETEDLK